MPCPLPAGWRRDPGAALVCNPPLPDSLPPPASATHRHSDRPPSSSSPAAAPHCACPARPPPVPRRRHPSAASLTSRAGLGPRRAVGKPRSGARTGRGATGCSAHPTPHCAPAAAPALPHPFPALVIFFISFPVEKEKPLLDASGRSPHTRAALRRTRLRGQRSVPAPAALAPPEPRGASREAAGARRRERSPFPPPRVCGSGRWRRGEPRVPRGMGRREGAEFSAVCERDKVWGAWPLSSSSGWNSCGRSGRGGGLPGQGPGWLAACPPGCGAGLSLITRDLTCPRGQRGVGLRGEAGERRGLAAGEKSGHEARKRPRPRTFLPGAAPTRSAARGGSGSSGARPPGRGPRTGHRPKGTPEPPSAGPQPGRPSLFPSFPPSRERRVRVGARTLNHETAHGQKSSAVTRAWRAGSGTSLD